MHLASTVENTFVVPLSIPPSLYWDGDDGMWSTFQIQVGTPGQTVRLLPGTSASAGSTIWVVISEGCIDVNPTLADCSNARGYLFHSNLSTTWSTEGIQTGPYGAIFSLNTFEESLLGLAGNASYGYDTVNLGVPGAGLPSIQHQVIAGLWTDDFFLGSLGLSPVPFNFTTINDPQPSMLSTLYNQSLIPSRSWGYTAGAYYNSPPVFGSLTLGGYDMTRFTSNNLTFSFGADFSRDLLVSLQSIVYSTAGSSPLSASSIDIFIDSMVTEIWLPVSVCEAFAQQFNLTWNEQGQLYLVGDESHTALLKENPAFTFTIGQAGGGGETVEIVLPYAAFDLTLTAPIVGSDTHYFPLKRAQNSTQYTLGRTFLQEAYVIADYERHNFSVSQALFPSTSVSANVVAILPPLEDAETKSDNGKSGLHAGAIAGIVIGSIAILALALAAMAYFLRPKKRRQLATTEVATLEKDKGEVAAISEMTEQTSASELAAHDGPGGRHELVQENTIHELDGERVVLE